jgi:hypothetical protein
MKIKCGYSMGFAGTDSEWTETVPEDVVAEGQEAIDAYLEEVQGGLWQEACEKISVWATIVE